MIRFVSWDKGRIILREGGVDGEHYIHDLFINVSQTDDSARSFFLTFLQSFLYIHLWKQYGYEIRYRWPMYIKYPASIQGIELTKAWLIWTIWYKWNRATLLNYLLSLIPGRIDNLSCICGRKLVWSAAIFVLFYSRQESDEIASTVIAGRFSPVPSPVEYSPENRGAVHCTVLIIMSETINRTTRR